MSDSNSASNAAQSFIVVYKDSATKDQIQKHISQVEKDGGEIGHRYDAVFKGFSAKMKPECLQSLQGDDAIDYIEPDQVMSIQPTSGTGQ
ncbi:hypothetical protein FRC03_003935 [Tulasnella sp. 419]|nr:hypothetical protein FRC03_003935 [Tulasnella sp. 419]